MVQSKTGFFRGAVVASAVLIGAVGANASTNEFAPQLTALAEAELIAMAAAPEVISAVVAQNEANAALDQAGIDALDIQWRDEVAAASRPMIDEVLNRPGSGWLRDRQDAAGGLISEVFVTDRLGLNVIQSDVTSDYWQGDEAKFSEVFGKPAGTLHLGEVEFDESAQVYQSQVSMAVFDPDTGQAIGTVTFGINLEYLQ